MRRRAVTRALFAAAVCLLGAPNARAHPVHTSDMEVDYNAATRVLEVALRFWPEDLARLTSRAPRGAAIMPLLQRYIQFFTADGKTQRALTAWTWVGEETTARGRWAYFTVAAPSREVRVQSHLFFGVTKKQVNTVRAGGQSLLFASDDAQTHPARRLPWPQRRKVD